MFRVKKWFVNLGKDFIVRQLDSPVLKKRIIHAVNRKVDIPNLNEKQEEDLYRAILNAVIAAIKAC